MGIPALPFCHLKLKGTRIIQGYPKIIKTIGDHLRKRRLQLGLFQKEVARLIGVSEATVYNWEKRRTDPPAKYFAKIINFLGYVPYSPGMSFGKRMLLIRKSLGLSQKEFSKILGLDEGTVLRIEKGRSKPAKGSLDKIKKILKI